MNKVTVRIHGCEYNMCGEESKEYLIKVGHFVDERMQEISKTDKRLSSTMIAVLTSLNIADELIKLKLESKELKEKLQKPLEELKGANSHIQSMDMQIKDRDSKIEQLEQKLEQVNQIIQNFDEEKAALEMELKEKDAKLKEAEEIAVNFQNKIYELQMKLVKVEKK